MLTHRRYGEVQEIASYPVKRGEHGSREEGERTKGTIGGDSEERNGGEIGRSGSEGDTHLLDVQVPQPENRPRDASGSDLELGTDEEKRNGGYGRCMQGRWL